MTKASSDSDLAEEDVSSIVNDIYDSRPETATKIRRRRIHVGGLSLAFEQSSVESSKAASSRTVHQLQNRDHYSPGSNELGQMRIGGSSCMATSAPVNVPGWSKIYRVSSAELMHDSVEFDSEMIPPHEYSARSCNKGATSVFEGVGRTLKGRDLNRVRNAVWSQTGFYG